MWYGFDVFKPLLTIAFCTSVWTCCVAEILDRVLVDKSDNALGSRAGQTKTAMRSEDGRSSLEIRCIPVEGLSARLVYKPSAKQSNADAHITYRTDDGSTSDDKAWPYGKTGLIMPNARQILEDSLKVSTLHIQIDTADGQITSMVFRPREAPKGLSRIRDDCPNNAQPPDTNGQAK